METLKANDFKMISGYTKKDIGFILRVGAKTEKIMGELTSRLKAKNILPMKGAKIEKIDGYGFKLSFVGPTLPFMRKALKEAKGRFTPAIYRQQNAKYTKGLKYKKVEENAAVEEKVLKAIKKS